MPHYYFASPYQPVLRSERLIARSKGAHTWHSSAKRSRMDRQRSTRWAASLYSSEEVSGEGVSGKPVRTCLEPVSLSQHSLHKGEAL